MQATENHDQFASAEMLAGAKATFIKGLNEVAAEIERFRDEEIRRGQDVALPGLRASGPRQRAAAQEKGAGLAIGGCFALGCLAPVLSQTICLGFGATLKILVLSAGLASTLAGL